MQNLNDHKSREHALLSASSAHRWLNCPSSAVVVSTYEQQDTDFTREGTLAHEVAEKVAQGGLEGLPENENKDGIAEGINREMIDCALEYREYIHSLLTEDTIMLLEQRVDFSPWVPDGFGTCDCVLLHDETLTIIDYKYGQGVAVSAIENPQMKLYALGALNDYGIAYEIKNVEMHIFQPRMGNISCYSLKAEDLLSWADKKVKPIAQKAMKGKGGFCAGEWCRFCQHAGRCRQLAKTCTEYVETHDLRVSVPVLAPYEIAEILQMEPLISLWIRRVKDQAMSTLLDGGEIPGYKVVEGRGTRSWSDEAGVISALKDRFHPEDYTKTELLSPAALEKAIGKKTVSELLSDLVVKKRGSPTIAPASDKREPYDRLAEAREDFK